MCGDSTSPKCVAELLSGDVPHLMVTDPPYGVNYDPGWRDDYGPSASFADKLPPNSFGTRARGKVVNDDRVDWADAFRQFPGDVAYVWHAGVFASHVADSLKTVGFDIRSQIIWVKQHFVFSRGDYHWQHEPCWYAVRKGKTGHYCGDRKQTTVLDIANNNPMGGEKEEQTGHGTQKPVECMRRPIQNNSTPGESVYDPFLGSGTTMVAAEQTGRICYGMELEPKYVAIILQRMSDMGLEPRLCS